MSNRGHEAKSSERVHVISRDKHWAIKKEGNWNQLSRIKTYVQERADSFN